MGALAAALATMTPGAGVAEVGGMRPIDHHAPVAELAAVERRAGGGHEAVASLLSGGSTCRYPVRADAHTLASARAAQDVVARRDRIRLARRPSTDVARAASLERPALSGHCPKLRRRARRGGRPAVSMAACVAPMS